MICTVASLDHLVLTVRSIPATIAFYQRLGMRHETFSPPLTPTLVRHALLFGPSKINLHESGNEFEPKAANVMPGSADICLLVNEDVEVVRENLVKEGVEVLEGGGVVPRTGARGKIRSVYVRDPDGNLVELSNYAGQAAA
ncbi:uncharacterized protein EHS24_001303 [Apiotrichum porosum]|uniref:VOC domain-containing protein n=1 Tax=Apiotrichum porosum TaxID=105984 RepID=A0A427XKE3_9TREE|nr:uncharacterized protein EHS24_001303 [Apiotrichum porosum]RSH79263.1 hypothetical protein EHS24_001303 [Apiotrichum porosum]